MSCFISLELCFIFLLLTSFESKTANYNWMTNKIFCDPTNCIHEIGHYLDYNSGLVSSSKEFREYFRDVNFPGINGNPKLRDEKIVDFLSFTSVLFGWGGYKEFYAYYFDLYDGCVNQMNKNVKKFYDSKLASDMLSKYDMNSCHEVDKSVIKLMVVTKAFISSAPPEFCKTFISK